MADKNFLTQLSGHLQLLSKQSGVIPNVFMLEIIGENMSLVTTII